VPEFLNEDYVTIAAELIFPNVQTCCAVIVSAVGVNNLGGSHITLFTSKNELDRVTLYLRTEIGGAIDCVYLVGNVLGRPGHSQAGVDTLMELKTVLQTGLGYAFAVKYHNTGPNLGTAVRAWRDPVNNTVRLAVSPPGNWVAAANVAPAMGMLLIRESIAASMDGNAGTKLKVTRPAGTVPSCTINAENPVLTFGMANL
jgi:hypothetical protein